MDAGRDSGIIGVPRGRLLSIEDGCGALVQVQEGEIWLTQERDDRDYVVRAGEAMRLDRHGNSVICALRRSVVRVSRPPSPYRRRLGEAARTLWTRLWAPVLRSTPAPF